MFEEIGVLYRGLILGFVIAAPVGPVGLMCIRRSLQKGVMIGLATGLGAALADTIYGAIAIFSVSAIVGFIHHYQAMIQIIGGLIVLATAWHTWHDKPKPMTPTDLINKVLNLPQKNIAWGIGRAFLSGFIVTLTNPLTLFGTLAVVATFGAINRRLEADVMIGGIFLGSVLWWCLLSSTVGLLRRHFTDNRIMTLNRVTAVILSLLGLWALLRGLEMYFR